MRYGTPPVVRATGGLADTVVDADANPRAGTGFVFGPAEPAALAGAVRRAATAFRQPSRFREIMARGMARDDSWRVPASHYEAAYQRAVTLRAGPQSRMRRASSAASPLRAWTSMA